MSYTLLHFNDQSADQKETSNWKLECAVTEGKYRTLRGFKCPRALWLVFICISLVFILCVFFQKNKYKHNRGKTLRKKKKALCFGQQLALLFDLCLYNKTEVNFSNLDYIQMINLQNNNSNERRRFERMTLGIFLLLFGILLKSLYDLNMRQWLILCITINTTKQSQT